MNSNSPMFSAHQPNTGIKASIQLDQLKNAYAEMIVEGMDMKVLIVLAVESIEQNLKDYDMDDLREEVCDCYGEETWTDMIS